MARPTRSTKTRQTPLHDAAKAIDSAKNSARNAFDTLVKRTRRATVATAGEARDMAIATVRKAQRAATAEVKMARTKTSQAVSSLEKVFETRVSRAIAKLGLPTTKDVRALSRQVTQLQSSVDQLRRSRARKSA